MDAADSLRLGQFWARALGLTLVDQGNGDAQLDGVRNEQRIWINRVPEPRLVKHRVHLDVSGDPTDLEALGATVLRRPDREILWTVMADVEGGEFCAFPREDAAPRILALVVDAADAQAQARWWGEVYGCDVIRHRDGWWSAVGAPGAPYQEMLFIEVPEPKTAKNRIHWDVESDDPDALLSRGARLLRAADDEISWSVLADPEGNEFCVFQPRAT